MKVLVTKPILAADLLITLGSATHTIPAGTNPMESRHQYALDALFKDGMYDFERPAYYPMGSGGGEYMFRIIPEATVVAGNSGDFAIVELGLPAAPVRLVEFWHIVPTIGVDLDTYDAALLASANNKILFDLRVTQGSDTAALSDLSRSLRKAVIIEPRGKTRAQILAIIKTLFDSHPFSVSSELIELDPVLDTLGTQMLMRETYGPDGLSSTFGLVDASTEASLASQAVDVVFTPTAAQSDALNNMSVICQPEFSFSWDQSPYQFVTPGAAAPAASPVMAFTAGAAALALVRALAR